MAAQIACKTRLRFSRREHSVRIRVGSEGEIADFARPRGKSFLPGAPLPRVFLLQFPCVVRLSDGLLEREREKDRERITSLNFIPFTNFQKCTRYTFNVVHRRNRVSASMVSYRESGRQDRVGEDLTNNISVMSPLSRGEASRR